MSERIPDWFDDCVSQLTSTGTQRVWSVLISIFGDLAQDGPGEISGALLTALTGLAEIKPEANRVALHRLRKDGWIESRRVGRTSVHHLTAFGRQQCADAAPRIYARDLPEPDVWHVLIANGSEASRKELSDLMLAGSYIALNPSTAMAPGPVPDGLEALLAVASDRLTVPGWLRDLCGPDALRDAYEAFWGVLQAVEARIPAEGGGDMLQTLVLRVLIVHSWRRIVLRHPALPPEVLPEGWKEKACREAVFHLLERLPRPSVSELEAAIDG